MKILFTGGGTAGHIFPIIAIAREIKKISPAGFQFFYIGPKDRFISTILSQEGIDFKPVMAGKLRRYLSFWNITDFLFKLPVGILQAFFHIFTISPDLIFSKGGYGSLPAAIAGWTLLTPIFLHESDVAPGLANRIVGKMSVEIFSAFPVEKTRSFPANKIISVGNPLRTELLAGNPAEAKKLFKLTGVKPLILILGGSQGAQVINSRILTILDNLLDDFEIIHQTGEANFQRVKSEAEIVAGPRQRARYHPFSFLNETELACAYRAADLVISRAGAGSIFEIASAGKPSILVPLLGSAQNHQTSNAYVYAEKGAAIVMEEANFTPHFALERIKYLFSEPRKMKEMKKKAKEFARPEAARVIAEYIVAYSKQ